MAIVTPNLRTLASKSSSLLNVAWIRSLHKQIHVTQHPHTSFNSFCNVVQPRFAVRSSKSIFQRSFATDSSLGQLPIVGSEAPDFTAKAVDRYGKTVDVTLSKYQKEQKFVILLFYPEDFDEYTAKELKAFSVSYPNFQKAGTVILGVSVNNINSHDKWINGGELGLLKYSLVSDSTDDHYISRNYNVYVPSESMSLRAIFIIDRNRVIQHSEINNLDIAGNNRGYYTPEAMVAETLSKLRAIKHKQNIPVEDV